VIPRVRVAALVVLDGRVLLARHVKEGRTSYLLPGGGMESAESAAAALRRELHEEADVACAVGALRYVVEARAPDRSRHIVQLVFAAHLLGPVGASRDPRVAACEWHPIDALLHLPLHPDAGAAIAADLVAGSTPPRYLDAPWRSY